MIPLLILYSIAVTILCLSLHYYKVLTQNQYGPSSILANFECHMPAAYVISFLLRLGCGTGNYTVALSEYVGQVTGLEVNEGMLGRAMEKTATLKNVSLTQGDVTKMPFPDNQFDAICCNLVSIRI